MFDLCLHEVTSPGRELEKHEVEIFPEMQEVVMFLFYSTEWLSESTKKTNFPENYWVPEEIAYPLQHFCFRKEKKIIS